RVDGGPLPAERAPPSPAHAGPVSLGPPGRRPPRLPGLPLLSDQRGRLGALRRPAATRRRHSVAQARARLDRDPRRGGWPFLRRPPSETAVGHGARPLTASWHLAL